MRHDPPRFDPRARLLGALALAAGCFQPSGLPGSGTASTTSAQSGDASTQSGDASTSGSESSSAPTSSTTAASVSTDPATSDTSTSSTSTGAASEASSSSEGPNCVCGDGFVGCDEDCDEHGIDTQLCTSNCERKWLTVFLTRDPSVGKFAEADALLAADARCQLDAEAADLPGLYRAWLSDSTNDAAVRLGVDPGRPFLLADGVTLVADDLVALTTSGPVVPIDVDAWGEPVMSRGGPCQPENRVWTGTVPDGSSFGPFCFDWTQDNGGYLGMVGTFRPEAPEKWTFCGSFPCGEPARLYCFEL